MSEASENPNKPGWLTELQQKSWEPEILLSGIVLYGLFQIPDMLDSFLEYGNANLFGETTDLDNLVNSLKVALYWLTCGLILHLISRGIWVGMVGLSFTFPEGVNKDNLKMSGRFSRVLERIPTIEQIIINLEKISSSLFSVSFMLFMVMIGAYLYILILLVFPFVSIAYLFDTEFDNEIVEIMVSTYAITILLIGAFSMLDFVTLGFLKRFKWLSKIYYPLYWLVSTITLSRFYRPIYYTIVSNYGKWKIGVFLAFFAFTSIVGVGSLQESAIPGESLTQLELWNNSFGTSSFSGYYDDQNEGFHSVQAQIQSDIISENTLRLFVALQVGREETIKAYCQYDSLVDSTEVPKKEIELNCASSYYHIYLNDSLLQEMNWRFHFKQHTKQRGLLAYVDITDLPAGLHSIRVSSPPEHKRSYADIPFYRELSPTGYYQPKDDPKKEDESYLKLKGILPK
ncbi:hypothetical protein [Marinoscillum sp.]|uniref:hypothetical protein n=1 Tax=Marinoscillum sp. TaxID=2024838 RepID=UPI003BABAA3F